MTVSVVIPTIPQRHKHLERLIDSLPQGDQTCEIIIIDNKPLTLSEKRNNGFHLASGKYILFIDDDNTVVPTSINSAIAQMEQNPDIGILGFVGLYMADPNRICDGGSFRSPLTSITWDPYVNKTVGALWDSSCALKHFYEVNEVANAFMVRREVFIAAGGFDAVNFPMDLAEADFCQRVRSLGYKIVMGKFSRVIHDSITYSRVPDFRRPGSAYYMAMGRVMLHRKHGFGLWFLPGFVIAYVLAMLFRRKPRMLRPFFKGVKVGLLSAVDYTSPARMQRQTGRRLSV